MNGESRRGDERVSSRFFALDEFVHEWEVAARPGPPEACKFYYVWRLAVNWEGLVAG